MTTKHYDDSYYESVYRSVVGDPRNHELLSKYWKTTIFDWNDLDPDVDILDFGCGLGQVSAALPRVTCYDASETALDFLNKTGRNAISEVDRIPAASFDYVLCSHCLEHCHAPRETLTLLKGFLRDEGALLLILPVEELGEPKLTFDQHRHFYCWNFQAVTNLLLETGFTPVSQRLLFGPCGLQTLARRVSDQNAVNISAWLGRYFNRSNLLSTLTIASKAGTH